jgi:hypothetical protein
MELPPDARRVPFGSYRVPTSFLVILKKGVMELIKCNPDYSGLFNDKRLEKRGLRSSVI